MNVITLKSPAKINLTLRVLRRRPDGYHDLVTLFHRISLSDTIRLKKSKSFQLRCSDSRLSSGEDNLITQAYRILQARFPKLGGVSVDLKKKTPMGAGLGGGSSNAAFFLLGMKKLYNLQISQNELLKLGARLGADVPFFMQGVRQGIGVGRGDVLQKTAPGPAHVIILAASREGLSTRDVYENLRGKIKPVALTKVRAELKMACSFLARKKYGPLKPFIINDLERSAFDLRPSLRRVIQCFEKQGIPIARMTGSGPTVFGIAGSLSGARRAVKGLRQELPSYQILVCRSY